MSLGSQSLTVAALVHYGPLAGTTALIDDYLDRPVPHVSLVSELDQIRACAPRTAVVLHQSLAHGVWAVEAAMRLAWERAAACVVTPFLPGIGEPTARLARRLRTPVFVAPGDSAQCALDLAAAITSPDAVRAELVARCAVLFGERAGTRGILGVINSEVPGVRAALVSPDGHVLVGRSLRAEGDLRVEVPGPDGRPWSTLVAELDDVGRRLVTTVETILRLARVPLAASVARARLDLVHDSARAGAALDALLVPGPARPGDPSAPEPVPGPGTELGWRVEGRHVAVFLRTAGDVGLGNDAATPGVISAWQEEFGDRPLVPRPAGWASWWSGDDVSPAAVAKRLRQGLARMRAPIGLVAGVGEAGEHVAGLRDSLVQAELASVAARHEAAGHVEPFAELGERLLLACLPVDELARAARVVLAGLLSATDSPTLLQTLVAVLDCGGSTSRAAARLGVHRNTVLGRLERIRSYGVDLDHPDRRLALHLAAYALTSASPG
jgi:hypothetical protein